MKKNLLILLLISLLTFSCNQTKEQNTTEEQERVEKTFVDFITAIEQADEEAYYSFLTDDFVGYDPGRPPLKLNDQFRSDMASFFETTTFKMTDHDTQEVIVRDDIAIHRHTGTIVLGSKKDSTLSKMTMKINYLDVMKKDENGDWKFKVHTLNMSQ